MELQSTDILISQPFIIPLPKDWRYGGNTNLILSQSTTLLDKAFFVSFIQCTVSLWTAATGNKSRLVSTEMKQM